MAAVAQELSRQGSEVMGTPGQGTPEQGTGKRPRTGRVTEQGAPRGKNRVARDSLGFAGCQQPLSEPSQETSPSSARRQRRRPLKYRDGAENSDIDDLEPAGDGSQQKPPRKTPAKRKTPVKRAAKRKAEEMDPDVSQDQDAEEDIPPKPPKKTPAKRTPQKKKAAATSVDAEQKPARKTPKKKMAKIEEEVAPQADVPHAGPACPEESTEPPVKTTPRGRPRRGAAQAAMKYLHSLAEEDSNQPESGLDPSPAHSPAPSGSTRPRRARNKRASGYHRGQADDDEDFVPGSDHEDENAATRHVSHPRIQNCEQVRGNASNGLSLSIMKPVWDANKANKCFREEHSNTWVFPEWIPAEKDWSVLSERESAKYLPQEQQSPAFKVTREGINEEPPPRRLHRFESLPTHPERWDMLFFVGGPVWAMDWCPIPDGADTHQYAAIYCHRRQDAKHHINQTYTEPGLIQLWDLGHMPYNSRPQSSPELVYGLAQDRGCVWILKWCPGGAWELPSTSRKAPLLPRLGLLAAGTSSGLITIYSLPHPDPLLARKRPDARETSRAPLICQAEGVITLRVGSFKASHGEGCGQVLSMDWLPVAPHNILAAGFFNGIVCLWDLSSKSLLQRIRSPDRSFTLLPYHSFLAHDNAIRALAFCNASRDLLVTGGDDRMVKMWDLRMTYEPVSSAKRFLSTEVVWPLLWPGVLLAQEKAYTPHGSQGLHYFEGGYMGYKPLFLVPRTGTMWSISTSDWLNSVVTSDTMGEVILCLMPNMVFNPQHRRTTERRFPVYFTDMVLLDAPLGGEEEESHDSTSNGPAQMEMERGVEEERETDEGGQEESHGSTSNGPVEKSQTIRKTVQKYYLHFSDTDMRSLKHFERRPSWKRMQKTEVKTVIDFDQQSLASLHKIRFNPNLSGQSWFLSAGHAGLVRLHCLRALNSPHISKLVQESQNQFNTMFTLDPSDSPADAVRHSTQPL